MNDNKIDSEVLEEIKTHLTSLDEYRFECYKKFKLHLLISVVLGLPLVVLFMYLGIVNDKMIFFILASATGFMCITAIKLPLKKYSRSYKKKLIPILIKQLNGFTYAHDKGISRDDITDFSLTPSFDSNKAEDLFEGTIEDIGLKFSEILLRRRSSSSDGSSQNTVIFKGTACILTMPFEFQSHTILQSDNGIFNKITKKNSKLENIKLEDLEFEKLFEVYSNNRQGAFYLLSPNMMNKIKELDSFVKINYKKGSNKPKISMEFKGNKIFILIKHKGNMFEPAGIRVSAYNTDILPFINSQIRVLINIVEQLKLDYLKQRKSAVKSVSEVKTD